MLHDFLVIHQSWNFPLLVGLLLILLVYFLLCTYHNKLTVTRYQPILFSIGILLLFAMIGSPLLSLSYLSFSLHMIHMSIIYFLVPPLILLGLPSISKEHLHQLILYRIFQKISFLPIYTLISFAILFLLYHVPFMLTFLSQSAFLQTLYVICLFLLAMIMWSPIAMKNLNTRIFKYKNYTKLSSLLIMPACLLFIVSALLQEMNNPFMTDIATHLCLPTEHLQVLPAPFNTKYDQILSGALMMSIHKVGIVFTKKMHHHL